MRASAPSRASSRAPASATVAWAAAFGLGVVAQEGAARADDAPLEVVVTGHAATGFRSRTSTDEAAREAMDVASLVEAAPGVHVRRLGGDDSFATLSIRGAASSEVGVVLAGIPLTGAADPTLDLATLPLWPGAGVRVLRSFAPATIGTSGYLGGVLVLEPPTLARGARTETWAAVGSFGARKLRVADVRRAGAATFATALSASRADGDYDYFDDDPALGGGAGARRTRTNNRHVAVSGIERVEVDLPAMALGVTLLGQARRQGLAGPARYPTTVARLDSTRLGAAADATVRTGRVDRVDDGDRHGDGGARRDGDDEGHGAVAGVGALRLAAFAVRERSSFRDPRGEIDPTRAGAFNDDVIDGSGASISWRGLVSRRVVVDAVVDGRRERFGPGANDAVALSPSARRDAAGVGGDVEIRAGDRVALAATARGDFRRDEASDAAPVTDLAPTGHAGVELALSPAIALAAHGGALARPPSFAELYGDRGALLGNPSLAPERATTVDAGARGRVRAGPLRLRYEAIGFVSYARDLIAFVPYGRSTLRAENLDRARLLGAELDLALAAGPGTLGATYTALATRNEGDDALARGKPLPGRPAHDLSLDAAYAIGPARLRYGLDVIAGTTADPKGTIVLPVRVLHGASAWVDVPGAEELRLGAQVDDLLDTRIAYVASPATGHAVAEPVSDLLGYPLPGRTVWVTARFATR